MDDGSRPGDRDAGVPDDASRPGDRDTGVPDDASRPSRGDVWEGYVESYMFPSGSDRVRIVFDSASGDGPRTGVVVFGDGTAPPPATDPDVGYPPGVDWSSRGDDLDGRPWEGFEYPIVEGSVAGARIQVTVQLGTLWGGWCELQTPIAQDASGERYGCIPNTGGSSGPSGCFYNHPVSGEPVDVDCGKQALCGPGINACVCDMFACAAGVIGDVTFDLRVTGDNGDGSVQLNGLHNVHLTR